MATTARCSPGATFVSEPFETDTVLAGYSKLVLWVASTSEDMDIYVALRVLDETNREIDFCGPALIPGISTDFYPLAKGWLKVSHRKLDTQRSTEFRPKHTHLRADHAPLQAGEIVPVEVEIIPNTGLIRKGHRLRARHPALHRRRSRYAARLRRDLSRRGAEHDLHRPGASKLRATAGRAPGEAMT